LTLAVACQSGEEAAQRIGNFRRTIKRGEVSTWKADEGCMQQFCERLPYCLDGEELITFSPQDE
jgi:hypothetical protein